MVRIAILGAGRWGRHLIRNFLHQDRADLKGVIDPDQHELDQAFTSLGVPASVEKITDWHWILQPNLLDAIVVATPAATHFEIIKAALDHGLHILAEKPLTLTVAESAQLTQQAQAQGCQLVIDHTYLFNPYTRTGRDKIPELGTLRYGYASRTHLGPVRQDVDALWDLAIHDISIFNHWIGDKPVAVQAWGHCWLQNHKTPQFPQGLKDVVWARLRYPQGVEVMLHLCWANPDKQRRLVLTGDRAALIFDELASSPLILQQGQWTNTNPPPFVPLHLQTVPISVTSGEPLGEVCRHFLDCIETQHPSPYSNGHVATELVAILVSLGIALAQDDRAWVTVDYGQSNQPQQ